MINIPQKKLRRHAIYRFHSAHQSRAEAEKVAARIGKSKTRVFKGENMLAWSPWIVDVIVGYE